MVEVTFTVSPRVRRIAAHDPERPADVRNITARSSGARASICRTICEELLDEITLEVVELPPGEKAILSLQLPAEFVIVFDPVTHAAQFLDVKGEPTRERQNLSLIFDKVHVRRTRPSRCGPGRCASRWRTAPTRACCRRYGSPASALHDLLGQPQAVPDRKAPAHQPDVPRHLPDRHARRRPAPQDHQPDLPVHRPQGLDRALRAGRRPRRLRSRAASISACCTRSSRPKAAPS